MRSLHIKTPTIQSESYRRVAGEIFLKLENLQPTGSFKIRGIGHLCQKAYAHGAKHFVSSSGGNAGLAAAYAARKLLAKATVVVPKTTGSWAQMMIKDQGAKVIVHGENWAFADELAQKIAIESKATYVPPFDHPDIFKGNSSLIEEAKEQIKKPSAILLSVGGGGLLAGVIMGLKMRGWDDVKVYAAETEKAASFRAAIEAGQPVHIGRVSSVALTLNAPEICAQAFIESQDHPVVSKVVSDSRAVRAMINFANRHRMMVEPACGATLSLLENDSQVQSERRILAIVCGGAGVNLKILERLQKFKDA